MTTKEIRPAANGTDQEMVYRTDAQSTATKVCTKCGGHKHRSDFHVRTRASDGLSARCRVCVNADTRLRYLTCPHLWWESEYRTRCKRYGLVPVIVSFTRAELIARWGDRCVDCGDSWSQLDHRKPVAAGGRHDLANCRPVCAGCNREKYSRSDRWEIAEFRDLSEWSNGGIVSVDHMLVGTVSRRSTSRAPS
jgi:5-methylcytosine-specific restriction endonuclease McrA